MKTIHYNECPLCQSSDISKFMSIKDHSISGETFDVFACTSCKFTFTQDIPDQDHIGDYYKSEDYISHSDTQDGLINKLYHKARNVMLDRKLKLIKKSVSGKKLLDYGAGTGYFLQHMTKHGFAASGVEIDPEARTFIKDKFDLIVNEPSVMLNDTRAKVYDAITMWHVLEHVEKPHELLTKMHHLLNDDGRIFIAVPNHISRDGQTYKGYWAAYDVPRHLWHFEPETMALMAKKNGFAVEKYERLPFDPFYNSLLSEKYKSSALALVKGGISGLLSAAKSLSDIKKSSSLIYVLKKKP